MGICFNGRTCFGTSAAEKLTAVGVTRILLIVSGTPAAPAAPESGCFLDVGGPPLPEPEPDLRVLWATPFSTEADGGGGATLFEASGSGRATLFKRTTGKVGSPDVLAAKPTKEGTMGTMGLVMFLTKEE
jgi:hypothetical protein